MLLTAGGLAPADPKGGRQQQALALELAVSQLLGSQGSQGSHHYLIHHEDVTERVAQVSVMCCALHVGTSRAHNQKFRAAQRGFHAQIQGSA